MRALVFRKTTAMLLSVRSEMDRSGSARLDITCARMGSIPLIGSLTVPLTDALMRELSAVRRVRELGRRLSMSVVGVTSELEHAESMFQRELVA